MHEAKLTFSQIWLASSCRKGCKLASPYTPVTVEQAVGIGFFACACRGTTSCRSQSAGSVAVVTILGALPVIAAWRNRSQLQAVPVRQTSLYKIVVIVTGSITTVGRLVWMLQHALLAFHCASTARVRLKLTRCQSDVEGRELVPKARQLKPLPAVLIVSVFIVFI